jgi:hypothetical protein
VELQSGNIVRINIKNRSLKKNLWTTHTAAADVAAAIPIFLLLRLLLLSSIERPFLPDDFSFRCRDEFI